MTMDLFSRLFRYRERAGRSPQEDFLTEAFAAVLEQSPDLAKCFVDKLTGIVGIEGVTVETQKKIHSQRYGLGYVDLSLDVHTVERVHHDVWIESKLESGQGEDQLNKYLGALDARSDSGHPYLVYLTKYADQPEIDALAQESVEVKTYRWQWVYALVKEWALAESAPTTLVEQFLRYLEALGMNSEITFFDCTIAQKYRTQTASRFWHILDEGWRESGIGEEFAKYTNGKWVKYDRDEYTYISYWSPTMQPFSAQLQYGFEFSPEGKPRYSKEYANSELPVAYIGVWIADPEVRASEEVIRRLAPLLDTSAADGGWYKVEGDPSYVAFIDHVPTSLIDGGLSSSYVQFFSRSLYSLFRTDIFRDR